ncbi:hypothetical protein SODALDRAFT_355058 [Sodiomyces alkalinus F11]|uniref:Uncharacterized protein n=1 Tax=Sodiomyces alkalinus (strain CBS 110278 / VKM F-3762 / F11) TaxID=1314773 RepID=A0A3N2Q819_SODAK|nr:hypothetical protein SODALDRAFT_355058 [Sodiomyces alkalinus F11]ROT42866.1 hypothetical protein SODALDRAFT_355058 [Sodiomyces alkalinus F11]
MQPLHLGVLSSAVCHLPSWTLGLFTVLTKRPGDSPKIDLDTTSPPYQPNPLFFRPIVVVFILSESKHIGGFVPFLFILPYHGMSLHGVQLPHFERACFPPGGPVTRHPSASPGSHRYVRCLSILPVWLPRALIDYRIRIAQCLWLVASPASPIDCPLGPWISCHGLMVEVQMLYQSLDFPFGRYGALSPLTCLQFHRRSRWMVGYAPILPKPQLEWPMTQCRPGAPDS